MTPQELYLTHDYLQLMLRRFTTLKVVLQLQGMARAQMADRAVGLTPSPMLTPLVAPPADLGSLINQSQSQPQSSQAADMSSDRELSMAAAAGSGNSSGSGKMKDKARPKKAKTVLMRFG